MRPTDEPDGYLIDPRRVRHLEAIARRLFAPQVLGSDERRDLAHVLDLIVHEVRSMPYSEPAQP